MDWANTISLDLEFPVTPSQTIDTVALGTLVDQAVATEAGTEFSVQQQSDPWQQDNTTAVVPFNITTTLDDAAILQAAENLGSVQFSVSLSRRSTVSGYTYAAQVRIVTHTLLLPLHDWWRTVAENRIRPLLGLCRYHHCCSYHCCSYIRVQH